MGRGHRERAGQPALQLRLVARGEHAPANRSRDGDGAKLEEIVEDVLSRRDRTRLFGALDTLEYLKKGGRIHEGPGL